VVTIRDVAKRAGVSVSTVSAYINGGKYISPELRERVGRVVKELDYKPNRLARSLALKQTYTLAILVPTISNPFFSAIVEVAEGESFKNGYSLLVCHTRGDSERALQYTKFLCQYPVDGLLLSLTSELAVPAVYRPFLDTGIPVVGLAGKRVVPDIHCFLTDDTQGTVGIVDHLLKLGHRKFAFIGVLGSLSTKIRLDAVRSSLDAAGIKLHQDLVMLSEDYTENAAYKLTQQLISRKPDVTALICYNDVMAVGALRACTDLGLNVPADISITGYDDTLASFTIPRLTTVTTPKNEMARQATKLLLELVTKSSTPPPGKHIFTPQLTMRESTAHPSK